MRILQRHYRGYLRENGKGMGILQRHYLGISWREWERDENSTKTLFAVVRLIF